MSSVADEFKTINLPPVIGIAGKAGSGKSTVASILTQRFPGYKEVRFAQKLKETLHFLFGWTVEQQEDFDFKERIDPRWGFSPRRAAQLLGTEFGRELDQNLWVNMVDKLPRPFVVTDVRFENEAAWVRKEGVLIHISAPTTQTTSESSHASEAGVKRQVGDLILVNSHDGILKLEAEILQTLKGIK